MEISTLSIVQIVIACCSMVCAVSIFLSYVFFKNTKKN